MNLDLSVTIPSFNNTATKFTFNTVTTDYVANAISALKNKTNDVGDNINCKLLKQCREQLSEPLTKIINKSLSSGKFPSKLKIAKVVAIHKSDSKTDVSNYRPISLLPVVSKLIEMTVKEQLLSYLDCYGLISSKQYGFRKKFGTQSAIFDVVVYLQSVLDSGNMALGLFCDLKKAFDTVNHSILIVFGYTGCCPLLV